jgi:hypothetical protein
MIRAEQYGSNLFQGIPNCGPNVPTRTFLKEFGMEKNKKTCAQIHWMKEQRTLQASLQQRYDYY